MKKLGDWEVIRRKVAIAGCIVDQQNQPIAKVRITIIPKAGKFKKQIENAHRMAGADWEKMKKRPNETLSRLDGLYFFLDVPDGEYTLIAVDPRSGKTIESHVTVSKAKEKKESGSIAQADFNLPYG